jgi:hypothetical protein
VCDIARLSRCEADNGTNLATFTFSSEFHSASPYSTASDTFNTDFIPLNRNTAASQYLALCL